MSRLFKLPGGHPAFEHLPVRTIGLGHGQLIAVNVSGRLALGRVPLVCLPGYIRNMADFAEFIPIVHGLLDDNWPIVSIDLRGRGRSSDRISSQDYSSTNDARDLGEVLNALGIEQAVFVGQGHGGQVIMALAEQRPAAIAGAALIDAAPLADSRGLVRLRNNLRHLSASRTAEQTRSAMNHMLAADYPSLEGPALARLAARTHFLDARGRPQPIFDPALERRLDDFNVDDVFEPQWNLFNALADVPLMLIRSQLTDQVRRETFEEMVQRRPDAVALTIPGQGSPALLDRPDDAGAIADFVKFAVRI